MERYPFCFYLLHLLVHVSECATSQEDLQLFIFNYPDLSISNIRHSIYRLGEKPNSEDGVILERNHKAFSISTSDCSALENRIGIKGAMTCCILQNRTTIDSEPLMIMGDKF